MGKNYGTASKTLVKSKYTLMIIILENFKLPMTSVQRVKFDEHPEMTSESKHNRPPTCVPTKSLALQLHDSLKGPDTLGSWGGKWLRLSWPLQVTEGLEHHKELLLPRDLSLSVHPSWSWEKWPQTGAFLKEKNWGWDPFQKVYPSSGFFSWEHKQT